MALVVDDDPTIGDSLQQALRGQPVTIECAHDVATAVALLDEGRFCGVVLDVVLGDGSGFDILRHMEAKQLDLPTIIVTKKLPSYVREMLDETHVKLVLPKPVEMKLLASIVCGLCGIPS
ncbi:MAG TPA: response regulator [Thermoanaerobaculia bacterium]